MCVNTRYINSTRGTSSKKDAPQWHIYIYIPYISGTFSSTGVHRHKTEPISIQERTLSFDLVTGSTYTQIHMLASEWIITNLKRFEIKHWPFGRAVDSCWHINLIKTCIASKHSRPLISLAARDSDLHPIRTRVRVCTTVSCSNKRIQNVARKLPSTGFISVQDGVYALRKPICIHPISLKFPQHCLWNGSNVRLIDNGYLLFLQGRVSNVESFHTSLLQVIDVVLSLA